MSGVVLVALCATEQRQTENVASTTRMMATTRAYTSQRERVGGTSMIVPPCG
jgi:hypothetical protein